MKTLSTRSRSAPRWSVAVLLGVLMTMAIAASASGTRPASEEAPARVGSATAFDGLGSPYGGCGIPQSELETQNFVALNVFDTPGDYSDYPRPVPPEHAGKIGLWDNGRNCGRWVQVEIDDYCTGINDGAPFQRFCRNGSWTADAYNGATLTMLVADSCADGNAWCRDDRSHLDLATSSLNRFTKNGRPVTDLHPAHWNNRRVRWEFVPAPNYSGDIRIAFMQRAQRWWPAISLSHLPNGVHGVEYFADGRWQSARPNSDMGQSFILGATTAGGLDYQIRVRDADDAPLNNGRVYRFTLPGSCQPECTSAYTPVSYSTEQQGPGTPPVTPKPPAPPAKGCTATAAVADSWPGGFQTVVTVRNTGTTATAAWKVALSLSAGQSMTNAWNAVVTTSGSRIEAVNEGYNAIIPPGGTTSWGMNLNSATVRSPTDLVCNTN